VSTAKHLSTTKHLATTPILDWPIDELIRQTQKIARYWNNDEAFDKNNGGIYSGHDDDAIELRGAEIYCQVLSYLNERPDERSNPRNGVDYMTQFNQIAAYCLSAMIQANYGPQAARFDLDDGNEGNDIDPLNKIEDSARDRNEINEVRERCQSLFNQIGIMTEADFSLFSTPVAILAEALGQSERQISYMRTKRRKEIVAAAKQAGVLAELNDLLSIFRTASLKCEVEIQRDGKKPLVMKIKEYKRITVG